MANSPEDIPIHLRRHSREFTFEKSNYYQPLWYRKENVLADGPEDFSELCDCGGSPGGLHFPHTVQADVRLSWLWGGANGAN